MSRTYNHKKPGWYGTTIWWKKWTRRQCRNKYRQLMREGRTEFPPHKKLLVYYIMRYE